MGADGGDGTGGEVVSSVGAWGSIGVIGVDDCSIASNLALCILLLAWIFEARICLSVSESDDVAVSSTSGDGVLPFGK